jgi:hypothetical protein
MYEPFLATWRPAGRLIRVMPVREPAGWVAFFCPEVSAWVADILGAAGGPAGGALGRPEPAAFAHRLPQGVTAAVPTAAVSRRHAQPEQL